jgi:hypothetical protein
MNKSIILYLIGHPGVGKLTIAKEMKDYILCDNHLINNVIFSLLRLDKKYSVLDFAWDCVGKIRDVVFDFISHDKVNNYVLTNVLNDDDEDRRLFQKVEELAKVRDSVLVPVKLFAEYDVHIKRIQNSERAKLLKSRDVNDIKSYDVLLKISHKNLFELDTTNLFAKESAKIIENYIKNLIE